MGGTSIRPFSSACQVHERRPLVAYAHAVPSHSAARRADAMELLFDSKTVRSECLDQATAKRRYGSTVAAGLRAALADLDAAVTVVDLPTTTTVKLTARELRVAITAEMTLVCVPGGPRRQHESLNWAHVYRLKLMKIEGKL